MAPRANQAAVREKPVVVRYSHVMRALERIRQRHPEARRPLSWNGAVAILRRERIPLVKTSMTREAAMIAMGGVTVFMVNSDFPPRRHTSRVAHELAHAYLHVDEEPELVLHLDSGWRNDDPREEEAELLADWLLYGIDPEQLTIPL